MKKYSLLKAIGLVTIIFILLSWIIPAGNFAEGVFENMGHLPVGLFSIFMAPFMFFNNTFASAHLLTDGSLHFYSYSSIIVGLLSIGIFYKVLNKTGAYGKLVEDVLAKVKNRKDVFLIGTILFFAIVSSLTGLSLLLFLCVPFFVTIILKLKCSKLTALASTVLAMIVGRIGAVAASDITGVSNKIFSLSLSSDIAMKLILLILLTVTLIVFVLSAKTEVKETEEDPLYDGVVKKEKSYLPIVILTSIFFVIMGICMFNWWYVLNDATITDGYHNLVDMTVGGYPIAHNLIGVMEPFGYWTGFTMSALLLILSLIMCFIYSISFDDFLDGIKKGTSSMAKVCIYVILAFAVTIFLVDKEYSFINTIIDFIYEKVTVITVPFAALATGIYSFFVNDFLILSSQMSRVLMPYYQGAELSLAVLTMQVVNGTISIIAPTSIFLVAGLAYLDIPYTKWLGYIWKLFLFILVVSIAIILIISVI